MPINKPDDRLDYHFTKSIPFAFRLNAARINRIQDISEEYIFMLSALFGDQISQGLKTLKDYDHLTMTDLKRELEFRTRMVARQVSAKEYQLREQHKRDEEAFMEELKKASQ